MWTSRHKVRLMHRRFIPQTKNFWGPLWGYFQLEPHTSWKQNTICLFFLCVEQKLDDGNGWKQSSECSTANNREVASSVLQTFSCVISQVIVSCEALILDRQFIYKKQTPPPPHTKKVTMVNFQRLVCDAGIGIQQMSTIKAAFPSVSNCYWCRASKSTQKHTITNGHQQFTL